MINTDNIEVFTQSSIRITGEGKGIYFDPFQLQESLHDADVVFITHDHYDHYSEDDIARVVKPDTIFVVPAKLESQIKPLAGDRQVLAVSPNERHEVAGITFETIGSYNNTKQYHPKAGGWVGYIVSINESRIYVAGDTDANEDNSKVSCDVALIPIGGTFTMNYQEAADFVNAIKPKIAIPTHYGTIVGKESDADGFAALVDKSIDVQIKKQY